MEIFIADQYGQYPAGGGGGHIGMAFLMIKKYR
jgi:hypothetical protein